ncbi:MAG: hypothetical protein BAJALOKI1v1_220003 [Promethearchaeota archaeon]|nr:MAG: hypothetical protein BAJALOKI1v1_220003 [Candidatus Lokiarchaeota archaeon]
MPLSEQDIYKFLQNPINERFNSELIDLLIKRVNDLCFKECQVDRIACTLNPMCTRRFLLKLRIKNGLGIEDLPKFCYSVHKGVVERYFKGKTVVYRPSDSYLYLIDFLDIYFHENYRRLNKFLTFKNWDEVDKIINEKIKQGEPIEYFRTQNHVLIKYGDYLHVIFLNEGYAICNANREKIESLELIEGMLKLYAHLSFSEVEIEMNSEDSAVDVQISVPFDVASQVSEDYTISTEEEDEEVEIENHNHYFWRKFPKDLFELSDLCENIHIDKNVYNDLLIKLSINTRTHNYNDKNIKVPLRFRDLKKIIDFLDYIYNKYYVIHLDLV